MDKIIENGFELIIGDEHQSDTINLSDIISGKDKISFFIDQYGDTINHYSLKNNVLLLDYWFLHCPPCIAEITGFDLLTSKFKDKPFKILSFSTDDYEDIHEKLFSKRDFKFSIISNARLLGRVVYPLKILLDKKGKVRKLINLGSGGPHPPYTLRDEFSPEIKKWVYK